MEKHAIFTAKYAFKCGICQQMHQIGTRAFKDGEQTIACDCKWPDRSKKPAQAAREFTPKATTGASSTTAPAAPLKTIINENQQEIMKALKEREDLAEQAVIAKYGEEIKDYPQAFYDMQIEHLAQIRSLAWMLKVD